MPPKTDELLTEIRDLLKAEHESSVAQYASVKRNQTIQLVLMGLKASFYVFVLVFALVGAYAYYSTILSITSM